jgi:hypothetical protein
MPKLADRAIEQSFERVLLWPDRPAPMPNPAGNSRANSLWLRLTAIGTIMRNVSEMAPLSQTTATADSDPIEVGDPATRTVGRLWIWLGIAALLLGVAFGWVMSTLGS